MILAIETSCDETAAAVVSGDGVVHSNIISSQAKLHAPYGSFPRSRPAATSSSSDP